MKTLDEIKKMLENMSGFVKISTNLKDITKIISDTFLKINWLGLNWFTTTIAVTIISVFALSR